MEIRQITDGVKNFFNKLFTPNSSESFIDQILEEGHECSLEDYSNDLESEDPGLKLGTFPDIFDSSYSIGKENPISSSDSNAVTSDMNDVHNECDQLKSLNMSINIFGGNHEQVRKDLLNDNSPQTNDLKKIFEDLVRLYDELDGVRVNSKTSNIVETISFTQERIVEIILNNGGTKVSIEGGFDIAKHKTIPFAIIPQGATISRINRIGIEYNGMILIKAIVEL